MSQLVKPHGKDGVLKQVVPDYKNLKDQYELLWDIPSNDGYLQLVAIMQKFVDQTVPQADFIGLRIPDDNLRWNEERGHYDFGEIDWEEFQAVLAGAGPCNEERMAARREAHEESLWIKEAAIAYAKKQKARAKAAA